MSQLKIIKLLCLFFHIATVSRLELKKIDVLIDIYFRDFSQGLVVNKSVFHAKVSCSEGWQKTAAVFKQASLLQTARFASWKVG